MSATAFVPFHSRPRGKQSARVGWIVAENGCHLWQGARCGGGYGVVGVERRMRPVHRVRYEREVGPVPEDMELDHFVCDTPWCCNPEHVRPASPRENTLRSTGITAQMAARTHCVHGHLLSGVNLYVVPRSGTRQCRECNRARGRVRDRQRRAKKWDTLTGSES